MFELPDIDRIVATALGEDLGVESERLLRAEGANGPGEVPILARDVTSSSVLKGGSAFSGVISAREACTVCGLGVVARVFSMLAEAAGEGADAEVFPLVAEGSDVAAGQAVAEVTGSAAVVLAAERTALDFLMILSGVATTARRWQQEAGDTLSVCDTRKTYPGLRLLTKYAVRVGGACNHRAGLWDMVLVKDNHLKYAGGITQAIWNARAAHPGMLVEVEADDVEQAVDAVRTGADMVLLDNMDDAALADAVRRVREEADARGFACLTEASGSITFERLGRLAEIGVDRVSSSALTFARPVDFGLDQS